MIGKFRTKVLILMDAILVNFSFVVAYLIKFEADFNNITQNFIRSLIIIAILATAIKVASFFAFKLYSSLWKYASVYELILIVISCLLSNALMFCYAMIFKSEIPESIFIITFFIDIFMVGGVRFIYRILRRIKNGVFYRESKRVLLIGGGDAGAITIKQLKLHPELKYNPVAVIDDDIYKIGMKINGVPIVGQRKDIVRVVEEKNIDEIIITIPSAGNKTINEIYKECSKTSCKVKILPGVSQLINEKVVIKKIRDVNILDLLGREPIKLNIEEISSYLADRTILVTGGGGSIGSELCRQIANYNPKKLIILDNYENNAYDIQNELMCKYPKLHLEVVIATIRDCHRIDNIFDRFRPEVVFHAAAHKHVPLMEDNPWEAVNNNVLGTLIVAECADKYKADRFVLISTDKAVNPTSIMGATKRIAEMIIQAIDKQSNTEYVAVRFGNVLGSNGSVIPLFMKQIEAGGPVTVTHPEITRFFMTIPEAVQLVLQAGAMANGGEIFVFDMGQPVLIRDLARNLIKLSGFEPDEEIKIEYIGLRPGEKLYEELLMAEEGLSATKNDKIFVLKPKAVDFELLKREIRALQDIDIEDKINEYIAKIVPTYRRTQ